VPYRGAAPAIQDLLAGQIDGVVDNPPTVIAHIQDGRLRPLAVAAAQRMALLPDLPSAAEAGLPGYRASSWFGIVAPAATPAPIIARLHQEVVRALATPAMQARFAKVGARLVGNTPAEFAAQIRAERASWGEIIRAAGIAAQ
jgi:tripartite-type tricarboxylate transporter receptor subunit TctC